MKGTRRYPGLPRKVDNDLKFHLRNRSTRLTSAQRDVLRKMGISTTKSTTEKEAVKAAKRVVTGKENYKYDPSAGWFVKKHQLQTAKPRRKSRRQAMRETLLHRGSNRSFKMLDTL